MTPRQRLGKIGAGVGMLVLGYFVFVFSKAYDPANRAALLSIAAIFVGLTWIGQGARGHRDLVIHHEEADDDIPAIPAGKIGPGLVLAWLIPGAGHYHIGRTQKALLYFSVITITFVAGVLLAQGRNLSYERDAVYFLAYAFNGVETFIGMQVTAALEHDRTIPNLHVGFLYTAVACLLNLVVMIDFYNTCLRHRETR